MIVEGKSGLQGETNFEFKYVPNLHKTTTLEAAPNPVLKNYGIERRNLRVFVIACGLLALMVFVGLRSLKLFFCHNTGAMWQTSSHSDE